MMKTKKIGAIFAVLMISLMLTGVAYAAWTETLLIDGSVTTGDIDAKFENVGCTDSEEIIPYFDVAICSTAVSVDGLTLTVTITDAYPSYTCTVTFDVANLGSVPAKIASVIVAKDPELDVTKSSFLVAGNWLPQPGCSVTIHVNNSALEDTTYTVTITIEVVAFNA